MFRPVMAKDTERELPAALPSSALFPGGELFGEVKSSAATRVQVPEPSDVASRL